ncbi:unnamed protein product [Closterium sp. NIES-65]|nr:unnamed protein product [Closterium sp. NIES-65]
MALSSCARRPHFPIPSLATYPSRRLRFLPVALAIPFPHPRNSFPSPSRFLPVALNFFLSPSQFVPVALALPSRCPRDSFPNAQHSIRPLLLSSLSSLLLPYLYVPSVPSLSRVQCVNPILHHPAGADDRGPARGGAARENESGCSYYEIAGAYLEVRAMGWERWAGVRGDVGEGKERAGRGLGEGRGGERAGKGGGEGEGGGGMEGEGMEHKRGFFRGEIADAFNEVRREEGIGVCTLCKIPCPWPPRLFPSVPSPPFPSFPFHPSPLLRV